MTKKDDKATRTKVHLPPDVVAAFRALGDDWEAKIEAVLRAHLDRPAKNKMRDFFNDVAGPYLPQIEAVTREVASKVAKDVAMAAATAAMASWSASNPTKAETAARPKPAPSAKPRTATRPKTTAKPKPAAKAAPRKK